MGKVETAINPDALLRDIDVVLRVHGPLTLRGNPFSLLTNQTFATACCGGSHSGALSALHHDVGVGLAGQLPGEVRWKRSGVVFYRGTGGLGARLIGVHLPLLYPHVLRTPVALCIHFQASREAMATCSANGCCRTGIVSERRVPASG